MDILFYLRDQSKINLYLEVGLVCTTDSYGVSGAKDFSASAVERGVTVKNFQQFLPLSDTKVEVEQLKKSGVRVFVGVIGASSFRIFLNESLIQGIIGENYVWLCYDGCANFNVVSFDGINVNQTLQMAASGLIGTYPSYSIGQGYQDFLTQWLSLPESERFNVTKPSNFVQYNYDSAYFYGIAIHNFIEYAKENNIEVFSEDGFITNIPLLTDSIRNTTTIGATGPIALDSNGDRKGSYVIVNFQNGGNEFTIIGDWFDQVGLNFSSPIKFFNGSTIIPDIDIRPPFKYFSCDDKEQKVDLTGKTINLHKPGASNPSNIDITYYCDGFIDCENLSDESTDGCSTNYTILFIVEGIVTGILIIMAFLFVIITIIFGIILKEPNFKASSPIFLIILSLSSIIGYGSIYSWFGKPQSVACGFQPWLLGLSVISMISCLCAKNMRIWRIFKFSSAKKIITDWELLIFWFILVVPVIFILFLWTLISTPTASLSEVDGEEHLICMTGGFTGPPGGFIFFFILVAYNALVLCFAGFLSFVTRNVPTLFNESKLIAISIYNLGFLSIVLIPVVIVLNTINPFASWIIRTSGIQYAFTVTLLMQFLPKILFVFKSKIIPNNRSYLEQTDTVQSAISL